MIENIGNNRHVINLDPKATENISLDKKLPEKSDNTSQKEQDTSLMTMIEKNEEEEKMNLNILNSFDNPEINPEEMEDDVQT